MEFKESIAVTIAEGESGVIITAGRATLRQVSMGLKEGSGEIRTARPVLLPGGHSDAVWIQKHVVVDAAKIEQLTKIGISELDVILMHPDEFRPVDADAAVRQLDRKRELEQQTAEAMAMTIHQCAVKICERCLVLFYSLEGRDITNIPLIRQQADSKIVRAVASLGEAMRELQPPVIQAINDLLNGEGRVLAALQGIHPARQAEAREALDLAIASVRVAYWFKKIVERGTLLDWGYEDIAPFEAADLEVFFLAGLLKDSGAWAGQGQEKHEIRSVHVIKLLRAHGCNLPDTLEELVLRHGSYDWKGQYVYQSELVMATGLADSREGEVSIVSFLQRDRKDEELSIQEELKPFARMIGESSILRGLPAVTTQIFVRQLPNKFTAGVLILALTEKFKSQTEAGQTEITALAELVLGLAVSPGYNLVLHKKGNLPMMAYVLAAIANAFNVLPVGALVEFKDENVHGRSVKEMLKLDGGLAVVVYAKDASDPYSPYLLLIAAKSGMLLRSKDRKIIPLGSQLYEKIYRGERRLVVGIVSRDIFLQFFSQNVEDVPRYREGLRRKEKVN
ncbi:MAG: hypothetical protein WAP55_02915 [Minisyncoccia bacterium]